MPLKSSPLNAKPQEIAAIDLGSNSFHMVIARVVNGALQVLGRLKQRVHLADGLDSKNVLSEEAIQRGLDCLALFAERLQGFPDNYTLIKTNKSAKLEQDMEIYLTLKRPDLSTEEIRRLAKDTPRYKALGNSMAVPVMKWIGEGILGIEKGGSL